MPAVTTNVERLLHAPEVGIEDIPYKDMNTRVSVSGRITSVCVTLNLRECFRNLSEYSLLCS